MEKVIKEKQSKYCSEPRCRRKGQLLDLEEFYRSKVGKYGRRAICKECYRERHGINMKLSSRRRNESKKNLPNTLTKSKEEIILRDFKHKCAITGSTENVQLDHFIPLSWRTVPLKYGLGGTTYANMIPLSRTVNYSKNANNPFLWIQEAERRFDIDNQKWSEVVRYVANKHNMSQFDFQRIVNQCYAEYVTSRGIDRLNSLLITPNKRPPYNTLRYLLKQGVNLNVAVEKYGNDQAKQFINNSETVLQIKKMKNALTPKGI